MKIIIRFAVLGFLVLYCHSCQNNKYRDEELYRIMEKGLWGFVDTLGKKVIEPQYISVSGFSNNLAVAVVDTFYDYRSDSTLHKLGLGDAKEVKKQFFITLRYGYINSENDFIIKPNLIRRFAVTEKINDTYFLINYTNELSFSEGLAPFQDSVTHKFGYIDTLGRQRIPAQYYNCKPYSMGKAAVSIFKRNEGVLLSDLCFKWGYIDTQGKPLTEFIYSDLTSCVKGRSFGTIISLSKDQELPQKSVSQNENGELEFEDIDVDKNMPILAIVKVLLDEHGNIIRDDLPAIYDYYNFSSDGIALAERQNAEMLGPDCIFIDKNGDLLTPHDVQNTNPHFITVLPDEHYFADATAMCEGYAGVKNSNGTWLFIDKNLNLYGPDDGSPFDDVNRFQYGLAPVCQDGRWGYIDKNFNIVIPLKYKWAELAGKHLLRVVQFNEKSHIRIESLINRRDSIVWQRVDNKIN